MNKEEISRVFFENVTTVCTKKKKSLAQVSRAMGKCDTHLAVSRAKNSTPTLSTIVAIAKVLKCPVKDLVKGL